MTDRNGSEQNFDVVVVGGGPGGSTTASFIAMDGHKVLLLEREKFPRHQVGESLLPATINGICVMLGVSEELAQANFTYKLGGTYRWGKHPEPWSFTFGPSSMIPGSQAFAYQVERMKFDAILLNNARKKGVDVAHMGPGDYRCHTRDLSALIDIASRDYGEVGIPGN